jgi:hypothetical protein
MGLADGRLILSHTANVNTVSRRLLRREGKRVPICTWGEGVNECTS